MATNTAASFTNHTGNASAGPFSISFSYLDEAEVDVTVDGVLKTKTTHYTFPSATTISFTSGNHPANGAAIKFQRDTNISARKVDFQDGSVLTETDLDNNSNQVLFAQQEITDKLNGIEEGATADQTNAEIRAAVEAATDSNVFTDADHSKLNAIEASATADQTAAEIRTLVENASDSNVFTDADHTKLNGIEASATADQTNAEIRAAVEAATDSNVFTDADHTKLNGIEASATADQTNAEIRAAVEAATDSNVFTDSDHTKLNGIEASATADQTNAEIKTAYEANSDTNAFTDAEKTKLSGIEASADVTDATNVDAAGAVMNSDLDTKGEILVGDGSGDPTALSVGTDNHVLVADSNEATGVKWATVPAGSGMSNLVEDTTPQLGGALDVQAQEINTSTTNGNIKLTPNGTGKVEVKGNTNPGSIQLNCENNSHGVTIKGPAHSAAASYTLTLPINIVNGQFLKTDTNGVLSWAAVPAAVGGANGVDFEDAVKSRWGTGNDLEIYHTAGSPGLNNIYSSAAGITVTAIDNDFIVQYGTSNKNLIYCDGVTDKNVELYFGGLKKAETVTGGFTITGVCTATSYAGDGSNLTGVASATADGCLYENNQSITNNYTIASGKGAHAVGPLAISATLTINGVLVIS